MKGAGMKGAGVTGLVQENQALRVLNSALHAELTRCRLEEKRSGEAPHALFDGIEALILVADEDGGVVFANQALRRALACSVEELARHYVLRLEPAPPRDQAPWPGNSHRPCTLRAKLVPLDVGVPKDSQGGARFPAMVRTRVCRGRWEGRDCLFALYAPSREPAPRRRSTAKASRGLLLPAARQRQPAHTDPQQ